MNRYRSFRFQLQVPFLLATVVAISCVPARGQSPNIDPNASYTLSTAWQGARRSLSLAPNGRLARTESAGEFSLAIRCRLAGFGEETENSGGSTC